MNRSETFIAARNSLWQTRLDLNAARSTFEWPRFEAFNWASEYFDYVAAGNSQPALQIVSDSEPAKCVSYAEMSRRSSQVAHFLQEHGLKPGDRILISLGNCVELWEATLAAIKLGITIIPASTLLLRDEIRDRVQRGRVNCVVTHDRLTERYEDLPSDIVKISVGGSIPNWARYENAAACTDTPIIAPAPGCNEALLLYFTSGTTAKAKLVQHSHVSYPIGHLTTMYWLACKRETCILISALLAGRNTRGRVYLRHGMHRVVFSRTNMSDSTPPNFCRTS
jgi:acetyl-CoA synthetase